MATLEKIRNKSVLLFVIIIVALLAFILGDFLTSGRTYFGSGMTVAEAGDVKVEYNDYQLALNNAGEQARDRQVDNGDLAQQVINQMLTEQLMLKEYEDLGIVVTNREITEALTGENIHPSAMQTIYMLGQYLGIPGNDPKAIYAAVQNPPAELPAEYAAQFRQAWAGLEAQVEQALLYEKFSRLVLGLYTANDLDAQSLYNDIANVRHITYAAAPLSTISDEEAQVTDQDRRAAWDELKGQFKLDEPVRTVDYIVVNIQPSDADRAAGAAAVEEALLGLNATEGLEAISTNPRFVSNRTEAPLSQFRDNGIKNFLDTAVVGQAVRVKVIGDTYTLAKLNGVSQDIDSINISMLGRQDGGSLDSLLAKAKEGVAFKDLADGETIQYRDSVWTSLVGPNVPAGVKAALTEHSVGEIFAVADSTQGQRFETIYRINKRNAPVKVYDVAEITFVVDPSAETLAQLTNDIHTFVSNHSSAQAFADAAAEAGYTLLNTVVTASSPRFAQLGDSRPVVKWLMNAKPGQVMPVYEDSRQTYFVAAALKSVYDEEYLPWNCDIPGVADQIEARAIANKKAAMLIERFAGKAQDVAGYAQVMGVEKQTGDAMFNAPMLARIGMNESTLQGMVAAAETGKLVGPVQGNNSVVVFTVDGIDSTGREFTTEEYTAQFNRLHNLGNERWLQNNIFSLLVGANKIENKSLDFIKGVGEE